MQTAVQIVAHHQPSIRGEVKACANSRRVKARNIVIGFALLFVASQVLLAVLTAARPEMRDPYFYDKFGSLQRLQEEKKPQQTLVAIGSSRTFYGFDAQGIEERLEAQPQESILVYNFGQFSAGPRLNSLYLHRLAALGCKPTVVLLEVLPPLLARRAQEGYERHFISPRRMHYDELPRAERYGWSHDELHAEWRNTILTPGYFLRMPIMGRATPWLLPPGVREDGCRQTDARGSSWIEDARATPEARAEGIARTRKEYAAILESDFAICETARLALADSIELCRREGIRLVLYVPPEAPSFRTLYSNEASRRIDEFLRELAVDSEVTMLDARDWLSEDDFIDGHHPLRRGAERCSARLVMLLAASR